MSKKWSARTVRVLKRGIAVLSVPLVVAGGLTWSSATAEAATNGVSSSGGVLKITADGSPFSSIYSNPTQPSFQVQSTNYGQMVWQASATGNYGTAASFSSISGGSLSSRAASFTNYIKTYGTTRTAALDAYGGSGTLANPWYIQTGYATTAYDLTQKFSYAEGSTLLRVDTTIKNKQATAFSNANGQLNTGLDCFFLGSDTGPTYFQGNVIQCSNSTAPGAPRISFVPVQTPRKIIGGVGTATMSGSYGFGGQGSLGVITNGYGYFDPTDRACYNFAALPTGFSTYSCGNVVDNGMAMSWSVPSIPAGGSVTRTYYASYDANLKFADLKPAVTASPASINLGENTTYTVSVTNSGPDAAEGTQVAFVLPAGMQFVSSNSANYDSSTGTWVVGALANGASASMTVTAKATAAGTIASQVQAAVHNGIDSTVCAPGGEENCGATANVTVLRPVIASQSTVVATPVTNPADGVSTSNITVSLRDALGAVIPTATGQTVAIASSLAGSTVSAPIVDNGNGTYSATVKSTVPGDASISFKVNGVDGGQSASVMFTALPAQAAKSSFAVSTGTKTADGTNAHTITVALKDSLNNPVSGAQAKLAATASPSANVSIGSFTEVAATPGTYTAPITSTVAGVKTISATLDSVAISTVTPAGQNTATFVAGDPVVGAGKSTYEVSTGNKVANGTDQHTATVTLIDGAGNPVTGAAASLSLASVPSTNVVLGAFVETTAGRYLASISSTSAGTKTITATYSKDAVNLSVGSGAVTFVPGPVNLTQTALTVSTGDKVAGVEQHTASVTVTDANNNPVSGASVQFSSTATLTPTAPVITGADGVATATISSNTAGTFTVAATANGNAVAGSPKSVTFVAGQPVFGSGKTNLSATGGQIEANGVATHRVTVSVVDASNNPVPNAAVVFTPAAELVAKSATTTTTGVDGIAILDVASTTAGSFNVTATVAGTAVTNGSPASVQFKSGAATSASSSWTVTPDGPVTANGTADYTATVTLRDGNNNPVQGSAVSFDLGANVRAVESSPFTTNASGQVVVHLTSTVAGSHDVKAMLGSDQIGSTKSLSFIADAPSVGANGTRISATTDAKLANGVETNTVTVNVVDANNNPVQGSSVIFALPAALTATTPTTVSTDAAGVASVQVASTVAGTHTLTATVDAQAVTNGSPATVTFVADAPTAGSSTFDVTPAGPVTANGSDKYTAAVTIKDANNNPVAGQTVAFTYSNALTGGTTAVSGSDGVASVQIASTVAGSYPITAMLGTDQVGATKSLVFTADAPAFGAGSTSITATGSTRVANGTQAHTATVTVLDQHGNPVPNANVEFAIQDPATAATPLNATTNGSGLATVDVVSTTAGTFNVTATVNGTDVTNGSPASVTFVADVPAVSSSAFAVTPDGPITANGADAYTAAATVRDGNGNPVAGQAVTFQVPADVSGPVSAVTGADGVASVQLVSVKAGSYPITAFIDSTQVGDQKSLVFKAGAPVANVSSFFSSPGTVEADGSAQHYAEVTVRDANNNPVSGVDVTFAVQPGATGSGVVTTGANGIARTDITTSTAGSYTVTGSIGGQLVGSGSVAFAAGAPAAGASSWNVTPNTSVTADGAAHFTATVTLRDGSNNPVQGGVVTFDLPTQVHADRVGPYETSADGTVSVDLTATVAGAYDIRALLGSDQIGDSKSIQFVAGAASSSSSTIAATPAYAEANGTHAVSAVVTLLDGQGNRVATAGDVVTITSTLGTVAATANNGDGTYTATITSTTPGAATIGYTLNGVPATGTASTVFVATPSEPSVNPSNGTTVSGIAEPGHTVIVKNDAGEEIGSTTAALDGSYTIVLAVPAVDGDVLTVTSSDSHGFTSPGTEITVDAVAPVAPVVVPSNGSSVAGQAEANSTVTIYGPGNVVLATGQAGPDGSFNIAFTPELSDGAAVTVTATDAAGNESAGTPLNIDGSAVVAPTFEPSNGSKFEGTGVAGNTVTVTLPNGGGELTATVDGEGHWEIVIDPSVVLNNGDVVSATQKNPAGTRSPATQITIDKIAPTAPVVDPSNGAIVKGEAENGSTVTVTDPATGTVLCVAVAGSDGTFECVIDPAVANGSTIEVTVTDPSGNTSVPVTVVTDSEPPAAPVVKPSNGSTVSGQAEQGSTVTVTDPATGEVLCSVIVEAGGTFQCVLDPAVAHGTDLEIRATDPAGNGSEIVGITTDSVPPVAPVVDPSNGSTLTGQAEPGSTVTVIDPTTGEQKCSTVAGTDGAFSCVIDPAAPDGTELEIRATDPSGNASAPSTIVTDSTAPTAPVIDPSNGSTITGSGEKGGTVTVTNPATGEELCTAVVGTDGKFSCTIDPAVPNGTELEITVTDPAGNTSAPASVTTDSVAPTAPVVAPSDGSTIKGEAEQGSTITVTNPVTGEELCSVVVGGDGTFSCVISPAVPDGTTLEIRATDPSGNASEPSTVVTDSVAPTAPVVDPTDGTTVTGSGEKGGTVTVTNPATGEELCTAVVGTDGKFSCVIEPAVPDSTTLEITVTDPSGNTSEPVTVVSDSTAPVAPVVAPSNGSSVHGTAEAGSTVTVYGPGNMVLATVEAGSDGSFSIPFSPVLVDGSSVTVTATDAVGNESAATPLTIDGAAVMAPTFDPSNGSKFEGSGVIGNTVTVTLPNGGGELTTVVGNDGRWTIVVDPSVVLNNGDVVSATQTNPAGTVSPSVQVTIDKTAPTTPVVDPSDGSTVTGGGDEGDKVTVTNPETGEVLCTAIVGADGKFVCTIDPSVPDGTPIEIIITDPSGNPSPPITIITDSTAPTAPVVDPTDGSTVKGEAEKGSTISVIDPATGEELCSVVVGDDGKFSCTIDPAAPDGTTLEVRATDPSGNVSEPTTIVTDSAAPTAPVVDPSNGSTVTGSGEQGGTVTVTNPDTGEELCSATVGSDGRFECVVDPALPDGTPIEIIVTDPSGNPSPPVTIITDSTAPTAPVVDPTDGSTIKGEAEKGSTITVTNPATGEELCSVVVGDDGKFVCVIDPAVPDGTDLEIRATDPSGNSSEPSTITTDSSAPTTPVVDPSDGSAVTGSGEQGATVTVTNPVTGEELCTTTVGSDGKFVCVIDPAVVDGTEIEITVTDPAGNTSPPATIITDSVAPTAPVVDPSDGSTIKGEAEKGSTITVTNPATGEELCSVVVGDDGMFECVIDPAAPDGTELEIRATDPSGNASEPTSVTTDSVAPTAPVVNPSNGSVISGVAEEGSTVTVFGPGNVVLATGQAGPDGSFAIAFSPALADGASVTVTATDASGNESAATPLTIDGAAVVAPTFDPSNGSKFEGSGVAGNTITVTLPGAGGTLTAVVGGDGHWEILVDPSVVLNNGDVVSATQTNPAGTVSPSVQVTIDKTAPTTPVVDPSDGSTVTGGGDEGDKVTVTNPETGEVLCTAIVGADGKFVCTIDPSVPDGTPIEIIVTDPSGNPSPPITIITDSTAPTAPVVDPTDGSTVRGEAEAGSTVTVTNPVTGEELCSVVAGDDGKFLCVISPAAPDGTTLEVRATDPSGNVSEPTTVVTDSVAPTTPVVDPSDGSTVTGGGDEGDKVTVTNPETGEVLCTAIVGADGKFVCTIDPSVPDGTPIEIIVTDPSGNPSPPVTIITDSTAPTAPVVEPSDGSTVKGEAEAGSTVTVTNPATGEELCSVVAGDDGKFLCVISPAAPDGTTLEVRATDPSGNVSEPTTVVTDSVAPTAPVVDPSDGSTVTGGGEGGGTVTVTNPETGEVLCSAIVGADGKFVCTIDPSVPDGTPIEIIVTDPSGNPSPPVTIVTDSTAPTAPVVEPTDGSTVKGEAEAGSTVTVTNPATGEELCSVVVGDDGKFTCTINPAAPDGTTLEIRATDPSGNVSEPTTIVTDSTAPVAPVVDPSDGSTVTGSGEQGGTVTVKNPETGEELCSAVVGSDGKFVCTIDPSVPDGTSIEIIVTDPSGNPSPPVTIITDSTAPVPPVVDPSNGSTVTGSGEEGGTVTVKNPETGEELCTAIVGADGKFVCTIDPAAPDGTELEITITDPAGNTSPPATVITDSTAPVPPVVDPSDGSTVTGSGEQGGTVTVTNPETGEELCSAVVGPDGTFVCTIDPSVPDGTPIEIIITDPSGNPSPPVTIITDATAPTAPVVEPSDGSTVKGEAEKGSTITVTNPVTGEVLCSVVVGDDGKFVCVINPAAPDGTDLEIRSTDPSGNASEPATITTDSSAPVAPIVDPSNGSTVTGSGEEGATVTVTNPLTGQELCTTTVGADGKFACTIDPAAPHGTEIEITITDPAGNTSEPTTVITDSTAPVAPVVDPTNGSTVKGEAEPGSTVTVKNPTTGEELCSAVAGTDGKFVCVIDPAVANGTDLEIRATDPSGNTSAPTTLTSDSVAPVSPTVNPSNGSVVSGFAEQRSTVTVYGPDGVALGSGSAGADGSFSIPFSPSLANGSSVSVTATDAAGNESVATPLTINGNAVMAPGFDPSNGTKFTGSGVAGHTITVTLPHGGGTLTATVGSDGRWSIPVDASVVLNNGDVVTATQTNPAGTVSAPARVTIDKTAPQPPVVDPSDGQTVTGGGEDGGTVTVTNPDTGEQLCTAVIGSDGKFVCTIDPKVPDGTPIEIIVTDPSGNPSPPVTIITDSTPPAKAVVDASNGKVVTGSGIESGAVVKVVDGAGNQVPGTAVVNPDGSFTFTPTAPLTEDRPVFVVVIDGAGNKSDLVRIPVDTTAPTAPVVDPSDGLKVTGGTIATGDTVKVIDANGNPIPGDLAVDDQGRFTFMPTTPLAEGDSAFVVVTDGVGNHIQVQVVIDTTKPSVPVIDPTPGDKVTGCAEAGSTVTVYDKDGNVIGTATAGADCRFVVTLDPEQGTGSTITIDVKDPAGNVSNKVTVRVGQVWMMLDADVLVAGSTQIAYGYGFQPGEVVTATMHSDPIDMGTQIANARGEVTFRVAVPAGIDLGAHSITLSGAFSGEITAKFSVIAAEDPAVIPPAAAPDLPSTGSDAGRILALGTIMIVVAGSLIFARRRKAENS